MHHSSFANYRIADERAGKSEPSPMRPEPARAQQQPIATAQQRRELACEVVRHSPVAYADALDVCTRSGS